MTEKVVETFLKYEQNSPIKLFEKIKSAFNNAQIPEDIQRKILPQPTIDPKTANFIQLFYNLDVGILGWAGFITDPAPIEKIFNNGTLLYNQVNNPYDYNYTWAKHQELIALQIALETLTQHKEVFLKYVSKVGSLMGYENKFVEILTNFTARLKTKNEEYITRMNKKLDAITSTKQNALECCKQISSLKEKIDLLNSKEKPLFHEVIKLQKEINEQVASLAKYKNMLNFHLKDQPNMQYVNKNQQISSFTSIIEESLASIASAENSLNINKLNESVQELRKKAHIDIQTLQTNLLQAQNKVNSSINRGEAHTDQFRNDFKEYQDLYETLDYAIIQEETLRIEAAQLNLKNNSKLNENYQQLFLNSDISHLANVTGVMTNLGLRKNINSILGEARDLEKSYGVYKSTANQAQATDIPLLNTSERKNFLEKASKFQNNLLKFTDNSIKELQNQIQTNLQEIQKLKAKVAQLQKAKAADPLGNFFRQDFVNAFTGELDPLEKANVQIKKLELENAQLQNGIKTLEQEKDRIQITLAEINKNEDNVKQNDKTISLGKDKNYLLTNLKIEIGNHILSAAPKANNQINSKETQQQKSLQEKHIEDTIKQFDANLKTTVKNESGIKNKEYAHLSLNGTPAAPRHFKEAFETICRKIQTKNPNINLQNNKDLQKIYCFLMRVAHLKAKYKKVGAATQSKEPIFTELEKQLVNLIEKFPDQSFQQILKAAQDQITKLLTDKGMIINNEMKSLGVDSFLHTDYSVKIIQRFSEELVNLRKAEQNNQPASLETSELSLIKSSPVPLLSASVITRSSRESGHAEQTKELAEMRKQLQKDIAASLKENTQQNTTQIIASPSIRLGHH